METRPMCEYHMELQEMITEINVSVKNIEKEVGTHWFDFKQHITESVPVRLKVENHEIKLQGFDKISMLLYANFVGIVISLITITVLWGSMDRQVEVNTKRLDVLEKVSYGYNDFIREYEKDKSEKR